MRDWLDRKWPIYGSAIVIVLIVAAIIHSLTSQGQGYLLVRVKGLPSGSLATVHLYGNRTSEALVVGDAPAVPLSAGKYRVVANVVIAQGRTYLPERDGATVTTVTDRVTIRSGTTTDLTEDYGHPS